MDITWGNTTSPIKHIEKHYKDIYKSFNSKKISGENISSLYELNNRAAMMILGKIILYENELKEFLAKEISKSSVANDNFFAITNINENTLSEYNLEKLKDIKKIISKNPNFSVFDFCDELMFAQIIFLIKNLSLETQVGIFTGYQNKAMKQLKVLHIFRNHFAHGKEIKHELMMEYKDGTKFSYTLATLLGILFRRYQYFINEIEDLLLEYNYKKIGIDAANILVRLKIQGFFNIKANNQANSKKEFFEFFAGYNIQKILKNDKKVMKQCFLIFGKAKCISLFGKSTPLDFDSKNKEIIYLQWYKRFLKFKRDNDGLSKIDTVTLHILSQSERGKLSDRVIKDLLHTSFIDRERAVQICKKFKIQIINQEKNANSKEVRINYLLLQGYKLYKENYLVNKNGDILKIINILPFTKQVTIRVKTKQRKKIFQASINGKEVNLSQIIAESFLPNPKGYEYISFKDGDSQNCKLSNVKWTKKSAY